MSAPSRDQSKLEEEIVKEGLWRRREIDSLTTVLGVNSRLRRGPEGEIVREFASADSSGQAIEPSMNVKRAIYLVVYSHWEGYVKVAVRAYLRNLATVEPGDIQEHPNLHLFVLRKELEFLKRKIEGFSAVDERHLISSAMAEFASGRISLDRYVDSIVDTQSNLSFDVVEKIFKRVDIELPGVIVENKGLFTI